MKEINYCHIVPLTFEERVNMYMKCDKLELAKMLAERDRLGTLDNNAPQYVTYTGTFDSTKECSNKSNRSLWGFPSARTSLQ